MNAPLSQPENIAQRVLRQDIQSMHAYAIQESQGMVKLDAMENPHRLPPQLQQDEVSAAGAQVLGAIAAEMAYGEGLQAHARAAELRLDTVPPMRRNES